MDLFKKCIPPLENVKKDSKISKSQIDEVVYKKDLPLF